MKIVTSMLRTRIPLFTILVMFAVLAVPTLQAQVMPTPQPALRTITVSGEGTLTVEPDKATVRFGIVSRSDDPEEARTQNAASARDAMNAVRDLGIEDRKMRMETLRLQPLRVYNQQTRQHEEVGYEATREVVVEVEDLDLLPTLVTEVVQKGANRLNGVAYGLKDRNAIRNQALTEAVHDARAKAELMAGALGAEVGDVFQINEQGVSVPRPMVRMEMDAQPQLMAARSAPEPDAYAAGEMDVRANVTIVFLIK